MMLTFLYSLIATAPSTSSAAPGGSAPAPLLDLREFEALVQMIGPGLCFFAVFVYLPLTVVGAIAWKNRSKTRPAERLPSRERALPPPPRGPRA